jgi:hypothetical protein
MAASKGCGANETAPGTIPPMINLNANYFYLQAVMEGLADTKKVRTIHKNRLRSRPSLQKIATQMRTIRIL